jgi:hypothetical protein
MSEKDPTLLERPASRREVMKTALYMTPAILTLTAVPAFAAKGSGWKEEKQEWKAEKKEAKGGHQEPGIALHAQ